MKADSIKFTSVKLNNSEIIAMKAEANENSSYNESSLRQQSAEAEHD